MKAWIMHGPNDLRFEDVPEPAAKPGWVVARVLVVQPSITELGYLVDPNKKTPALMGHEFCGKIVEVGEGVTGFQVGHRIACSSVIPCGTCRLCLMGRAHACRRGVHVGDNIPGAFAEYVAVPAAGVCLVPTQLTDHEVACLQPLGSSVSAVETAQMDIGDSVVVIGQGVMGSGVMQVARASGAGLIIAVDVREPALELARNLGADVVIDARTTDPVAVVMDVTQGVGVDIAFDAAAGSTAHGLAGVQATYQALEMACDGGRVVQVGIPLGSVLELNPTRLRRKGIRYLCPNPVGTRTIAHAARLVARKQVHVTPHIRHILDGLDKLPEALEITGNKVKHGTMNPAQLVVHKRAALEADSERP